MMMKEIDICPPCATKIHLQVQQALQDATRCSPPQAPTAPTPPGPDPHPPAPQGLLVPVGAHEDIRRCLASLPICDLCRNLTTIYIISLPPEAFSFRQPPEVKETTQKNNEDKKKSCRSSTKDKRKVKKKN